MPPKAVSSLVKSTLSSHVGFNVDAGCAVVVGSTVDVGCVVVVGSIVDAGCVVVVGFMVDVSCVAVVGFVDDVDIVVVNVVVVSVVAAVHGISVHFSTCCDSPLHFCPLHSLSRDLQPSPHVTSHKLQALQLPHSPTPSSEFLPEIKTNRV